jgi:lipopolysaccharide transport protein LptA
MLKPLLVLLSIFVLFKVTFAEGRINISADSFKAYGDQKAVYKGKVIVTIGEKGKLTCDILTAYFDKQGEIEKVVAEGHVIYRDNLYTVVGNRAEYDPIKGLVTFSGNVLVKGKSGILKGDKAVFNVKNKRFTMFSKGRVNSVFKVKEGTNEKENTTGKR